MYFTDYMRAELYIQSLIWIQVTSVKKMRCQTYCRTNDTYSAQEPSSDYYL
jgi:hypothetical protein